MAVFSYVSVKSGDYPPPLHSFYSVALSGSSIVSFDAFGDEEILFGPNLSIVHGPGNSTDPYVLSGTVTLAEYFGTDGSAVAISGINLPATSVYGSGQLLSTSFLSSVSAANDAIYGGGSTDLIQVGSGNDTIVGGSGQNTIIGGNGNDWYYGGASADTISGGSGTDVIVGGGGNDDLSGGNGFNYIYGGDGNDLIVDTGSLSTNVSVMFGGAGTDSLFGTTGTNYFYGGAGRDFEYGGSGLNIFVSAGDEGGDNISGGSGLNYFYGSNGGDFYEGGQSTDVVICGAGNDDVIGSGGVDYVWGGAGANTFSVFEAPGGGVYGGVNGIEQGIAMVISDFTSSDVIQWASNTLHSFQDLMDHSAFYSGLDTTIISDGNYAFWLIGIQPSQLTSANFSL